jgi:hypothetical protein
VLYALGLLFVAFLVLLFASRNVWIILLPFHLICGWFIHASKALPHLFGQWQEAILPIGCLLMAAVIAHRFVRRWVDEKFSHRAWRIRHTAGALTLLLLGSAAAIAASGVVHQMFWLAGGKVIESNRRAELTMATNNGRQLMRALHEYQANHGRYPESFEGLVPELIHPESLRQLSWLGSRDGRVPEPWILLKPRFSGETIVPVILSPVIWSGGVPMVVVGYSDASMRSIRVENLAKLLRESRIKEGEGGR